MAALWCGSAQAGEGFDVVVLGARGGIQDGNLTAYLVHPRGDSRAVTCDAGSLVSGLIAADAAGSLDDIVVPPGSDLGRVGHVLTQQVKGYLISHAHLDHVAGLLIASPDDTAKPIYGLPGVLAPLVQTYFNWIAWPNFTDRGTEPRLRKYRLADLEPGRSAPIADTAMTVTPFPLDHGGVLSTAFLIEAGNSALLCFGDTGPDAVQRTDRMAAVWAAVADRVRTGRLKGLIIEVSYADDRPDAQLFGHLTPRWLLASLHELDRAAGGHALAGLPVIVSHIKYALTAAKPQEQILRELEAGNDLGLRFILPEQGQRIRLD